MPESNLYKSLLESTMAIPWKINWETKEFEYIGPQIETILGWPVDSWKTATDWIDRIHPTDRRLVVDFCISQSDLGADHEATYRALKSDGGYVWIRDVVHVMRGERNETIALVGFMFKAEKRISPDLGIEIQEGKLNHFKLTNAEEKIAQMIASGASQREISNQLHIKSDTVRKHLQSIYRKTSTNNQSQLIRLMLNMPNTKVDLLNN